jgi:histidine ammonia-lyase
MGTIAARDLDHVVGLAHGAATIHAMAIAQGFFALESLGVERTLNEAAKVALAATTAHFEPVVDDRALDGDIRRVAEALFLRKGLWT